MSATKAILFVIVDVKYGSLMRPLVPRQVREASGVNMLAYPNNLRLFWHTLGNVGLQRRRYRFQSLQEHLKQSRSGQRNPRTGAGHDGRVEVIDDFDVGVDRFDS